MKRLLLLAAIIAAAVSASAQRTVKGLVVESDSREGLAMTTVKLMKADSTLVKGLLTTENGAFSVTAPEDGKYIVRITCVGFKSYTRNITIKDGKDADLGTIALSPDAIMLEGATVTGHAAKVTVKEDTFIYNAAAYRTPEGSVIEELVKKLPGATVDDDGKITINGKEVKKILVDGKEFMTGDTKTAMKNLPTSIIEKVKAYDEKSDLARVSGIDDGEEETVLDFGIKKGMNKGFFTNNDLAIGTKDRYAARIMGASMKDNLRVMGLGNANNVNDMGFPGGGGGGRFGGGRQGLTANKMAGVNVNYEKKNKLKVDGSIRWEHSDGDAFSKTASENFVSTAGSFSNSLSQRYSRGNNWNAQMRLEWMPDTMTNIMFRPTASLSKSDGLSASVSAMFKDDPYLLVTNPLDADAIDLLDEADQMVNHRMNNSISYSDSKSLGGMLQINRKLSTTGRNVTLRMRANYGEKESNSLSTNNVHLYQTMNILGLDSTYQTNRYNLTPQKNYNYSVKATYSEPIMRATFLQFSYEFQYKYTKSERSTFDFSNLGEDYFSGITPAYRGWDGYLARLENPLDSYLDDDLSRFSEYTNYIHDIQLMLRVIRKAYNFNVGVTVMPQRTHFIQNYQGHHADTTRTVTNVTPTMDFRWKISKVSQLRFNYRGYTSQPSMTDLLDITDNSDPLNITMGNPGLKPSFTNTFYLRYNNYIQHRQQAIGANVSFNTTSNSISNRVTYNEETGGRTSRPENINGNWNTRGSFFYNMAIDTAGYFNINTTTDMSYANNVGYISLSRNADSEKNVTRAMSIMERLAASYRNDWFEFELNGSFTYNYARNKLQPNSDLDTWRYSYGFNTNVTLPWGTRLATDLSMNSRRGFNDESMNTNELIWNAQLSHSFLKKKSLTLSLQMYDLLHRQSTISRTINAMSRSDVEYNAITNYAMLHVIYKMNAFGGKGARQGIGPGDGGPGRERGSRMSRGTRGGGGGFGGPGRF
ncbi:MAG: TonB-dependent receptor [Prevotella sp.]|nr:TonB-dependent receptor [Prevotella sp.]